MKVNIEKICTIDLVCDNNCEQRTTKREMTKIVKGDNILFMEKGKYLFMEQKKTYNTVYRESISTYGDRHAL